MNKAKLLIVMILILKSGFSNIIAQCESGFFKFSSINKVYNGNLECDIISDSLNSMYVLGSFYDTTYFNDIRLIGKKQDIFFSKLDLNGNFLWAKRIGSDKDDKSYSISASKNSIYIAGRFLGTLNIDTSLVCLNGPNAFVAKYNYEGQLSWVRQGIASQSVNNLKVITNNSNIYLTGSYSGSITFDGYSLNSNNTSRDIFIVKYDTLGNIVWVKSIGGTYLDDIYDIYMNSNNIYLAGEQTNSDIAPDIAILYKLDTTGNKIWEKKFPANSSGLSIAKYITRLTNSTDLIFCGYFSSQITLGSTTLLSNGLNDYFVCRIDSSGTSKWAINYGTANNDIPYNLKIDGNNSIFLTGYTNRGFGGSPASDVNICKFDCSGGLLIEKTSAGFYDASGYGMTINDGGIYIAGNFIDSISFDENTAVNKKHKNFFIWNICPENVCTVSVFDTVKIEDHIAVYDTLVIYDSLFISIVDSSGKISLVNDSEISLKIFPNPADKYLLMRTNGVILEEFIIQDLNGKVIKEQTINSDNFMIDLESFQKGIYILKIRIQDQGYFTKKIIIN